MDPVSSTLTGQREGDSGSMTPHPYFLAQAFLRRSCRMVRTGTTVCSGGMRTTRLGSDSAPRLRILGCSPAVLDRPERIGNLWAARKVLEGDERLVVAGENSMPLGAVGKRVKMHHYHQHEHQSQKSHMHERLTREG